MEEQKFPEINENITKKVDEFLEKRDYEKQKIVSPALIEEKNKLSPPKEEKKPDKKNNPPKKPKKKNKFELMKKEIEKTEKKESKKKLIDLEKIRKEIENELNPKPENTQIKKEKLIKEIEDKKQELYKIQESENFIKTGIKGFDELLPDGIPKKKMILISGGPGTGKTLFAMECLYWGAKLYNETGVYISLEEDPASIAENAKSIGMKDIDEFIKKKKLIILKVPLYEFETLKIAIEDTVSEMKAKRIVLDSITVLSMYWENPLQMRKALIELYQIIKRQNCTTFILAETERELEKTRTMVEEFTSDGVIVLYYVKVGDARVRGIEIIKMRGVEHEERIVPFKITDAGIIVYPEEYIYAGEETKF